MKDLVSYISKSLIENSDNLEISEEIDGKTKIINVTVDKEEIGKLIGKQGKIANSIRTILKSLSDEDEKYVLNINERNA